MVLGWEMPFLPLLGGVLGGGGGGAAVMALGLVLAWLG